MKRKVQGLASASGQDDSAPDGVYLVQVASVRHQWERVRPFYLLRFSIMAPKTWGGGLIVGRLWSTPKALWKLSWFLRDFGYDVELLGHDEVDEKQLLGLTGVVKVSRIVVNGTSLLNLDGFAPAAAWEELSPTAGKDKREPEVA